MKDSKALRISTEELDSLYVSLVHLCGQNE